MSLDRRVLLCALAVAALAITGCGGAAAGKTVTLKGTINGAGESGTIDFTLPNSATAAASAASGVDATNAATAIITFTVGNKQVSLSGTYDSATGNFSLSGNGYMLTGNLKSGIASGTYTGPNGSGQFAAQAVAEGTVKTFCGTYTDTVENGTWNVTVGSSGACTGSYFSNTQGKGGALSGKVTGTSLDLNSGTATGTINGDSVTGTYKASNGKGTFTGTVAACTGG